MFEVLTLFFVILGIACGRIDVLILSLGFGLVAVFNRNQIKIHIIHEYKTPTQIINPTLPPEKKSDLRNE